MKRFLEWGLIVTVAVTVLAFGGATPLGYALMEGIIFLLFFILILQQTRAGKIRLPIPLALFVLILWVLLQLVPVPHQVVEWLSPARALLLQSSPTPGQPGRVTFSIYPHDTLMAMVKLLAYGAAFVLAAVTFNSQERKSTLIRALILLGCLESAYGTVQYLTGYQKIFTYTKQAYVEEATGTYINHNHFAGFLELVLPWVVAQTYFLMRPKGTASHPGGSRSAASGSRPFHPGAYLYVFLIVVILIGVVFSRSRMGIFSAIVSLIFMAAVSQIKEKNKALLGITFLVLCAALAYAAWIGLSPVLSRFEALEHGGITTEGRVSLWKSSVRLIRDYPVSGTGLGTFQYAFSAYQNTLLEFRIDHAHNDYLEFTSDLGVPGVILLFGPMFYLLGKMIVVLTSDASRYRRSVLLGCIGCLVALLTHTVADFNLQIPANAMVFAVILGIGYKVACLEPTTTYAVPRSVAAPAGRGVSGGNGGSAQIRPS